MSVPAPVTESSEVQFSEDVNALRSLLRAPKTLPVLFVGSGMSRRFIGAPDWDGLLDHFARLAGRSMPYYRGLAENDMPAIASLIASDFYDIWWTNPDYEISRNTNELLVQRKSDPMKIEIANFISALPTADDESIQKELTLLASVKTHAVITTNWDDVIEKALHEYKVYVGQQDVLFSATQSVGEIYKIHGSTAAPRSLVLTQEDYKVYWDKNPYLIAKMLTLFVEHPVIFLGYSLRDPHIQRILGNIVNCLSDEQLAVLNQRVIFIGRPGPTRKAGLNPSSVTIGQHTIGVYEFGTDNFVELFSMLAGLPEHFPIKMLRRLKERVYELAQNTDPNGKLFVLPFDAESNVEDVDIVIGIGLMAKISAVGYSRPSRRDLFLDMLKCDRHHDAIGLTEVLIPAVFKNARYAPIYYPLYLSGRVDENGAVLDNSGLPDKVLKILDGTLSLRPYAGSELATRRVQEFSALLAEGSDAVLKFGLVCQYDIDDLVALRDFLVDSFESSPESPPTPLAVLGCYFDELVFGGKWRGSRHEIQRTFLT